MNKSLTDLRTKVIVLLFLFFCDMSFAQSQMVNVKANKSYQMNWYTLNLKGKVKSIREENYKHWVGNDLLTDYVTKEYYDFDVRGNVSRQVVFLENESFHTDYRYTFDLAGNYTEIDSYDESGNARFTAQFVFDSLGRVMERTESMHGRVTLKNVSKYEDIPNGYKEFMKQVYPVSQHSYITKYMVDSVHSEKVIENYFDSVDSSCVSRSILKFDSRGNTLEETEYRPCGEFNAKMIFVYNKNNQRVYYKVVNQNSINTDLNFEIHWAYDANGNEIEYKEVRLNGISKKSYRTKYEYDAHGNWIRRQSFMWNGSPRNSVERKIEYYE